MVQFLLVLLLKQIILAVYHDFHWLLAATKLLATKRQSRFVKESESGVGVGFRNFGKIDVGVGHFTSDLESDSLSPTLLWRRKSYFQHDIFSELTLTICLCVLIQITSAMILTIFAAIAAGIMFAIEVPAAVYAGSYFYTIYYSYPSYVYYQRSEMQVTCKYYSCKYISTTKLECLKDLDFYCYS